MTTQIPGLLRTHHCGELNSSQVEQNVTLTGWVYRVRDLGGLFFIDLRDKYGITQLSFAEYSGNLEEVKKLSLESVIQVEGKVALRPDSAQNKDLSTGSVEVHVQNFKIFSTCENPPFLPEGKVGANEDLKLKYRYLDLRTFKLQHILSLRSQVARLTRETLYDLSFTEVETPVLFKTTPEGARDYIVPSRVHPKKVYALPQSPQLLKQLLMIGGTDKYFQICHCFRDEDLRADRQPEFTQLDIEVSFGTQDYIKNLSELLIRRWFKLPDNFTLPTITYDQAMNLYGSDKPDTRFALEHMNVTQLFSNSGFATFTTLAKDNGLIKAMFIPENYGELSRKELDDLTNIVKPFGGKGVAYFKVQGQERTGGIAKFIDDKIFSNLPQKENGLWLFCADKNHKVAHESAGALRLYLGDKFKLKKEGYHFLWVYDFPLLEYNAEENRYFALHHPFTAPRSQDLEKFFSGNAGEVKAFAYDVVCNGHEIGGGSQRIFDPKAQSQMFKLLGMGEEEVQNKFGFFVEALKYGTPPHGGIAFGMDRLLMLLAGTDNIRDVIAFPKTASATDLMSNSPSAPSAEQTKELSFDWIKS